jgi:hypothetical protein
MKNRDLISALKETPLDVDVFVSVDSDRRPNTAALLSWRAPERKQTLLRRATPV